MKSKIFSKQSGLFFGITALITVMAVILLIILISPKNQKAQVAAISFKPVGSQILAEGTVRSENETTLHFQTGGKLTYLPFKEGDYVSEGQTVASLDTYTIQKQLEAALNNYRVARNTFDQTQVNAQYNILQAQQKNIIDASKAGVGGTAETDVVNDIAKRIIDQNQANLDNSVIQVELANNAYSLASITAPINGVIIHEDVTTPYVNVTPQTSFVIEDPSALIFRANVAEDEIPYISEGAQATIKLSGLNNKPIIGTVVKIYPEKITLSTGEDVYQVDIASEEIATYGKYKQDGAVLINNKYQQAVLLVPSWLVLNKQYVWILQNGKPTLRKVTVGETIDDKVQILSGITPKDQIIVNPSSIVATNYITL